MRYVYTVIVYDVYRERERRDTHTQTHTHKHTHTHTEREREREKYRDTTQRSTRPPQRAGSSRTLTVWFRSLSADEIYILV